MNCYCKSPENMDSINALSLALFSILISALRVGNLEEEDSDELDGFRFFYFFYFFADLGLEESEEEDDSDFF
jgi:hypothetical protein